MSFLARWSDLPGTVPSARAPWGTVSAMAGSASRTLTSTVPEARFRLSATPRGVGGAYSSPVTLSGSVGGDIGSADHAGDEPNTSAGMATPATMPLKQCR